MDDYLMRNESLAATRLRTKAERDLMKCLGYRVINRQRRAVMPVGNPKDFERPLIMRPDVELSVSYARSRDQAEGKRIR